MICLVQTFFIFFLADRCYRYLHMSHVQSHRKLELTWAEVRVLLHAWPSHMEELSIKTIWPSTIHRVSLHNERFLLPWPTEWKL